MHAFVAARDALHAELSFSLQLVDRDTVLRNGEWKLALREMCRDRCTYCKHLRSCEDSSSFGRVHLDLTGLFITLIARNCMYIIR
jgi:hypothetical protein